MYIYNKYVHSLASFSVYAYVCIRVCISGCANLYTYTYVHLSAYLSVYLVFAFFYTKVLCLFRGISLYSGLAGFLILWPTMGAWGKTFLADGGMGMGVSLIMPSADGMDSSVVRAQRPHAASANHVRQPGTTSCFCDLTVLFMFTCSIHIQSPDRCLPDIV